MIGQNVGAQMTAKDELIRQLQQQIEAWKSKYEALAKLYSQLRGEHLDLLNKSKGFQLKANSAQEAVDRMERMERDVKSKNLELADMIRERDRARFDVDRLKSVSRTFLGSESDPGRVTRKSSRDSDVIYPLPTSVPKTLRETRVQKYLVFYQSTIVSSPSSRIRFVPSRCRSTTFCTNLTPRTATSPAWWKKRSKSS